MGQVRQHLLDAQTHLDIWERLSDRTEADVRAMNPLREFFKPTIGAHLMGFYIKASIVVDTDPRVASLNSVIKMIEEHAELAPGLSIIDVRRRLKKVRRSARKLSNFRDQRVAHWDATTQPAPAVLGPTRSLLSDLQGLYNEISSAHSGDFWSFRYQEHTHVEDLIAVLKDVYRIEER